jgi:hypothetical protein
MRIEDDGLPWRFTGETPLDHAGERVRRAEKLTTLVVLYGSVGAKFFERLAGHPSLEHVAVLDGELSPSMVAAVERVPSLRIVRFGRIRATAILVETLHGLLKRRGGSFNFDGGETPEGAALTRNPAREEDGMRIGAAIEETIRKLQPRPPQP